MNKIFLAVIPVIILFSINIILKAKHPVVKSVFSTASGVISLVILESLSALTGFSLPLNLVTAGVSAIFGLPGIGTMLVLNSILK